jgi:hypothetical protein
LPPADVSSWREQRAFHGDFAARSRNYNYATQRESVMRRTEHKMLVDSLHWVGIDNFDLEAATAAQLYRDAARDFCFAKRNSRAQSCSTFWRNPGNVG